MESQHETMCASVEDETAHEIRTRRGNYMGSLRLRGRTFWALRTMLVVGANTGLRLGDCAMLKWENIDFDSGFIRVKTIKTGANVSIPLLGELREELESRKSSMSANGYVMPSMANSYATSPKSATDAMSQVFRKSGVGETVKPRAGLRGSCRGQ